MTTATNAAPEEFGPEEAKRLEREIEELSREHEALGKKIRELNLNERPAEGVVYAQELHAAKHDKLRIETEILLRRNRLRRHGWMSPDQ